jgi:hypothetical protein
MHSRRLVGIIGTVVAVVLVGVAFAVPAVVGRGGDTKGASASSSSGWHGKAEAASHSRRGLKFVYVRGGAVVEPGAFHGGTLTCPRKFPHPMSGFFDSNSERVVATTDRPNPANVGPRRVRAWAIGVTNLDSVPANVSVGTVCIK